MFYLLEIELNLFAFHFSFYEFIMFLFDLLRNDLQAFFPIFFFYEIVSILYQWLRDLQVNPVFFFYLQY